MYVILCSYLIVYVNVNSIYLENNCTNWMEKCRFELLKVDKMKLYNNPHGLTLKDETSSLTNVNSFFFFFRGNSISYKE